MLKLDISKAFDLVSWSFLLEVLQHLGFGRKWCDLICLLLSTSTTQILVNRQPGPITHARGHRQADPLSPMLFILVMDVQNSLMVKASSVNLLIPIAGGQSTHRISFYADDVILFLRPTWDDLLLVRDLLEGLKTNMLKNSATPIQCTDEDTALVSEVFSCAVHNFPCTYLGLPLSISKPCKADFLSVIDKVAAKLPSWKASLLSKADRLVVVKSVLTAVTIYLLIAWDLPKWVIKAIDKKRFSVEGTGAG
ncbi:hypothetical protein U9M48_036186 [Paspalum notatum var. saurae]|uniref:Reverse transcriptase domain-containing protein n=1 Tax=Paspalum notatum var. saurae TaxID=547442 RepID=A0AAQ3X990_PASNO